MGKARGSSSTSISNLSMNLIESAFLLLVNHSLPVYRYNISRQRPPVAAAENVNAAASIVMLITGLDYHMCRLKYLRDVAIHKPPLPYTPYFDWTFGDALSTKLRKILINRNVARLLSQLVEITVCRDSIVHPKFYTITHSWDSNLKDKKLTAKLAPGAQVGSKAIKNKMLRKDLTKLLRLPLIPTWVSYVDAVLCILVLYRFLNLLERQYGNPYALIGGITAYPRQTKGLFVDWNWQRSYPRELHDRVNAFYQPLSPQDQLKLKRVLRGRLKPYLREPRPIRLRRASNQSLGSILKALQTTVKPTFLHRPPPRLHSNW